MERDFRHREYGLMLFIFRDFVERRNRVSVGDRLTCNTFSWASSHAVRKTLILS